MKTTQWITQASRGILALLAAAFLVPSTASAAPSVSFYGYQINMPQWRSTNFPKVITLAGQGSITKANGHYGEDGYILPSYVAGLPSYAPLSGVTAPGTVAYASGTYAQDVDDPTKPVGPDVANLSAGYWSIAYQMPGAGGEANLYNFTLSGTVPGSFLIGVAFGNLDTPAEDAYGTAFFRASIGTITTQQIPAIGNDKQIDWIFFRVDNAQSGDTIKIFGTGGAAGMASVAAISFDPVPQPANPGTVWDLATDFSTTTNPNGPWSYGYGYYGATSFTALPQSNDILGFSGLNGWWLPTPPIYLPVLAKNTTAAAMDFYGSIVPAGGILAYPGDPGISDIVMARWTAPATGVYNIDASWTRLDPASTATSEAHIYKNLGTVVVPLYSATTTVGNPSYYYGADIPLVAGDTLDFMVYTGADGPATDGIDLSVTITEILPVISELPTLTITKVGGDVRLAWPSSTTGYTLQSSTTLASGSFAPAGLTVVTEGAEFAAYEALIPAGKKFYRLATP